jgi:hypothetical protein
MKYDVYAVPGYGAPIVPPVKGMNYLVDQIREIYTEVAEFGGKIVASHTLNCQFAPEPDNAIQIESSPQVLFLVAELPDTSEA